MLGTVIAATNKYKVTEELGQSSRGPVYLVKRKHFARLYRLKVIGKIEDLNRDPEWRALSGWDHPVVLKAQDCFRHEAVWYLVQDHVGGETLSGLKQANQLPDVLEVMEPLLDFLHFVHEQGCLLGDLHPDHLICSHDGRLLMSDLVHVNHGNRRAEYNPPPSHPYLAPEREQGNLGDVRSDLYAAGAILRLLNQGRNAALAAVSEKACSKNPNNRFPGAAEFLTQIIGADTGSATRALNMPQQATVAFVPGNEPTQIMPKLSFWQGDDQKTTKSSIWGEDQPTVAIPRPDLAPPDDDDLPLTEDLEDTQEPATVRMGQATLRKLLLGDHGRES